MTDTYLIIRGELLFHKDMVSVSRSKDRLGWVDGGGKEDGVVEWVVEWVDESFRTPWYSF